MWIYTKFKFHFNASRRVYAASIEKISSRRVPSGEIKKIKVFGVWGIFTKIPQKKKFWGAGAFYKTPLPGVGSAHERSVGVAHKRGVGGAHEK